MKRLAFDVILLLLYILVMDFNFTRHAGHEVLGCIFFVAVLIHLFLNRNWFRSLFRGRYNGMRIGGVVINFGLIGMLLLTMIAGIAISSVVFRGVVPLDLARNMLLHRLHKWAPFVMLILIGLHLGWHGSAIWPRAARFFGLTPGKGTGNMVAKILQALTIILGIFGSFFYQIGDRLEMVHLFGVGGKPTLFLFALLHLSIIGLYAVVGRYVQVFLRKK